MLKAKILSALLFAVVCLVLALPTGDAQSIYDSYPCNGVKEILLAWENGEEIDVDDPKLIAIAHLVRRARKGDEEAIAELDERPWEAKSCGKCPAPGHRCGGGKAK